MSSPPDDGSGNEGQVEDGTAEKGKASALKYVAPRLVEIEVWCRTHGLDDVAHLVGQAVDEVDRKLTGSSLPQDQ